MHGQGKSVGGQGDLKGQLIASEVPSGWIAKALSGGLPVDKDRVCSRPVDSPGDNSLESQKWSGMRLVDTVMLDGSGAVESWVLTAKSGHVTRKKRAHDRSEIVDRFARFALANPRNSEGYVALACNRSNCEPGERLVFDKKTFEEAMRSESQFPRELLGATLQCYLRPQRGTNSYLRGSYCPGRDQPFSLMEISPLYETLSESNCRNAEGGGSTTRTSIAIDDNTPEGTKLRGETQQVLASLAAFLDPRLSDVGTDARGFAIHQCHVDFIVDDNGELWLTSLPSVTLLTDKAHDKPAGYNAPAVQRVASISLNTTTEAARLTYMPPLEASSVPSLVAPAEGGSNSFRSAHSTSKVSSRRLASSPSDEQTSGRRQTKEQIVSQVHGLPAISTMLGPRSSSGDHKEAGAQDQEGTTPPIFEHKDGVYLASVHASTLRGLCCWREVRQALLKQILLGSPSKTLCPHTASACLYILLMNRERL